MSILSIEVLNKVAFFFLSNKILSNFMQIEVSITITNFCILPEGGAGGLVTPPPIHSPSNGKEKEWSHHGPSSGKNPEEMSCDFVMSQALGQELYLCSGDGAKSVKLLVFHHPDVHVEL